MKRSPSIPCNLKRSIGPPSFLMGTRSHPNLSPLEFFWGFCIGAVQQLYRVRKQGRTEVLILCRSSQILESKHERNRVIVCVFHLHPTDRRVPQIVEREILATSCAHFCVHPK